jgi:hypothetical protein
MNPLDAIILALTPGTPFNDKGLVFRSVDTLRAFAGISTNEVMDLLIGDLALLVTCKPSKKNKGVMVALKAQLQVQPPVQIKIAGGPAFNAPLFAAAEEAKALNAPIAVAVAAYIDELEENLQDEMDAPEEEEDF